MSEPRPVVILAAHGERGGAGDNQRLQSLADAVAEDLPEADVAWVLVNDPEAVPRFLEAIGERPAVFLPLLFSDGFFYRERLKPYVIGSSRHLSEPLAFWPEFSVFLADNLAHRLAAQLADPRIVLVAHGSKSSSASADAARSVAGALQGRFGRVEPAFLEEAPLAQQALKEVDPPFAMIGLFFGDGMHGGEDFARLVSEAPNRPVVSFTIGELPGLADLVGRKARQELEKLRAG